MKATVWVCPTPECGDYYASSSAPDLSTAMNTDAKGNETFARAQCPQCRQRGKQVDRKPVTIVIPVPAP